MQTILLSAFTLGILGSLHCLGMCGPLVMNMPFQQVEGGRRTAASALYHLGKLLTYSFFGIFAGIVGKGFALFQWQQVLSIVAGISLLLITLLPFIKNKIPLPRFIQQGFSTLFATRKSNTPMHHFFTLGILNGFLPCGLVYAALAAATVTASPLGGGLFMCFFGLGTIPSLSSVIFFQGKITVRFKHYFQRSAYYLSIVIGLLLILRGFNLGIPYVSPKMNAHHQQVDCCHKSE